ncbi:BMP family ABC transporter substrate-binding protein [Mesorhizobium sp. WSM4887]|uniref:BMP family lipoprotein n=1 Tax=Mesorhizobium sp. WSM4887 TaxID=3038543 RepID=UPI002415EACD|nr:BMP family ABC transporter substrate-binding protein [Mesorhizobium sp. WSM4887]MDG4889832.1 BMP family ABC transporter substrate-binding protein [Mesorhizobium sp. WSM4887]
MKFFKQVALCASLSFASLSLIATTSMAQAGIKVAFVTAEGGLGDHSFNDMIADGLKKAKTDLGIKYEVIQPRAVSDFKSSLVRAAAAKNFDLVLGASFDMIQPMKEAAAAFPDQKFGIVDVGSDPIAPNVVGGVAKDWEGSFIVGVAAAMTSKTGTIGFVGGKDIPVIHRFFNGYYYGAKTVKPDIKVLERYSGSFTDPAAGKEYTLALVNAGSDINFAVANLTGAGVIDAAKQTHTFAIGVDSNQNYMAPGTVLTSMMKRVDVLAYDIIKSVVDGTFKGGANKQYGLKEGGVQAAMDQYNKGLISDAALAKMDELTAKVVSGEIVVPNYIDLDPNAKQMGKPPIDRPSAN